MVKKKLIAYLLGGTLAVAVALGLMMILLPKFFTVASAVTIICISLAFGIMCPNPISIVGFIAGILMLIFPANIIGIVFICFGIIGALANLFIWKKQFKTV